MKSRWLLLLLLLLVCIAFWWFSRKSSKAEAPPPPSAVPVVTAEVARRDVPIWLEGIGSVQAFNTVTVRPRVGGSLDRVHFEEGQMVEAGDVLASIDPRTYQSTLDQAITRKAQNDAQLENAARQLERLRILVEGNAESRQMFEQQEALVAEYAARQQGDQVAIDAARLDLDFTTVRAPLSGQTGIRQVDAGNLVTANQPTGLVVITQVQPINVNFTLPQQNLAALSAAIRPGGEPMKVEALGEDGKVLGEGALELIDNQIDPATGTLRLKAKFSNENLALWPGQFVSARVLVETRRDTLVVPPEAVQPGLDGPFGYVVKADQTVEARELKTGLRFDEGRSIVIDEGLEAGETIVVTGHSKLRPGSKVTPQEPAQAP